MILDGNYVNYCYRNENEKQDKIERYKISSIPNDLTNKMKLLINFKMYFDPENNCKLEADEQNNIIQPKDQNFTEIIYVKKWLVAKHAILFRLSNCLVQVIFEDKTEIILSKEMNQVTYVNKKMERLIYNLNSALESNNREMTKRLSYTKDILTIMFQNNQEIRMNQVPIASKNNPSNKNPE